MSIGDELDKIFSLPTFIRNTSSKPLEGYVPSWIFEDTWEESDDTFRKRIKEELRKVPSPKTTEALEKSGPGT